MAHALWVDQNSGISPLEVERSIDRRWRHPGSRIERGNRFLVASPRARDLLFCAKHLFFAATQGIPASSSPFSKQWDRKLSECENK
jgi:hypothetical protein